jgi:hypothetical protein
MMKREIVALLGAVFVQGTALGFTGGLPDSKVIDTTPHKAPQTLLELKGVLSWATLADVHSVKQKDKVVSEFSSTIRSLDKTQVKVQGFMIPLEAGATQKWFLLSAAVQTCDFCLPGGPETLVEVRSKVPVKFTNEPIVMSGKFTVAGDSADGILYRLADADIAPR